MSQENRDVLKAHLEAIELEAAIHGRPIPKLVFPSEKAGSYLNHSWWSKKIWYRALEKTGVHRRTPHQIRHTFATRLLENGEPLTYVKETSLGTPQFN